MKRTATFSEDRKYRYTLWRDWSGMFERKYAVIIGLNPSTADETTDDPTIRRCINYAKDWGYNALCMVNLFAFRATNPSDMLAEKDPTGDPSNLWYIKNVCEFAEVIVAAWGTHGTYLQRDDMIKREVKNLHYLKLTKEGHPSHPLYLPKTLTPIKL